MTIIQPLNSLSPQRFETPAILKKLAIASRNLAELKGVAASIPRQSILINTLGIQEAKDSSAIESIHPFYDGNGRTGRIINVLYLVKQGLLDIPVLYLSRSIVRTKADYYRLLQAVREQDAWEEWVLYMLTAVEHTATDAIATIHSIREALMDAKHRIRAQYKFYSQDLINNLFTHPYTKIEFIERDLKVSRLTATKYLDALTADGFLQKQKIGRSNYYINLALNVILTGESMRGDSQ